MQLMGFLGYKVLGWLTGNFHFREWEPPDKINYKSRIWCHHPLRIVPRMNLRAILIHLSLPYALSGNPFVKSRIVA